MFLELIQRHGLCEEIALDVIAARGLQPLHLLLGFRALGHDSQTQPMTHGHDVPKNASVLGLAGFVPDELHVQLQNVHPQLPQHIQGGVAAAEVVHLDGKAQLAQLLQLLHDPAGIVHIGAFRDFQVKILWLHAVLFGQSRQGLHQILLKNVRPGDIHGNGNHGMPLPLPLPQKAADLVPHIPVKPGNEAVLFKQGNELARRHEAPLGMNPAHQRLGTGDAALLQAVLGLKIHQEFLICQSRLHGIADGLLPQKLCPQGIVVNRQKLIVFSLDAVHRQKHPIAHLLHLDVAVSDLVNAPAERHLVVQHLRLQLFSLAGEPPGVGLLEEQEPIRAEPPAEVLFSRRFPEDVSNRPEQPVALPDTEGVVEQLEIFYVRANDTIGLVRIGIQTLPELAVEKLPGIDPGKPVVLQKIYNGRVFPEVNQAGHPVQNHLRPVGLGYEVRGTAGKSRHLVLLTVGLGGDDYGDRRQHRIPPEDVQQGIAVHFRHHDVQQDQRDFLSLPPEQRKRSLAVLRLQDLITFLQNRAQNLPVQFVVLNNQNLFTPHCLISRSAAPARRQPSTFPRIFLQNYALAYHYVPDKSSINFRWSCRFPENPYPFPLVRYRFCFRLRFGKEMAFFL